MADIFKNIKKTPKTLPQQPDQSHMLATSPRALTGVKPKKTFSTPDFKQAKSVDSKPSVSDQGFVSNNPYVPFNAYPNSKGYGTKITRGK
jgi:hypothetical protein